MTPLDILGIAAHPDDVELSCAGTFLAAKRSGRRTGILDLTQGELSTRGTLETRAQETDDASKILGLDYRKNLQFADGNIPVDQATVHAVIREIRATRPSIIAAPYFEERHPDHEAAAEIAHRAAFYAGLAKIETMDDDGKPQAPHRPQLVLHFLQTYSFIPKFIVDVSDVFEDRMRCIHAYGSQFGRGDGGKKIETKEPETFLTQGGFYESIEARARSYGLQIGCQFGEPFWCQETPGVRDIFSLVTKKIA
jgi:N-acetylglucosamine malate deacetylase 1